MKEYQENIRGFHYSEKGGHFLRGSYWKAWRELLNVDNDYPQYRAALVSVESTWQRRRFMPRYGVQDGRR